jgi:hypothetical protein
MFAVYASEGNIENPLASLASHAPRSNQDRAGRVVDLVAVEIRDRQHRSIADRIEEFFDVPRGAQGYRLGLAVAHHRGDDQSKTSDN